MSERVSKEEREGMRRLAEAANPGPYASRQAQKAAGQDSWVEAVPHGVDEEGEALPPPDMDEEEWEGPERVADMLEMGYYAKSTALRDNMPGALQRERNADYFAYANPERVLRLLDDAEKAKQRLAEIEDTIDGLGCEPEAWTSILNLVREHSEDVHGLSIVIVAAARRLSEMNAERATRGALGPAAGRGG